MEDDVCAARGETGDLFIADLIDRDAATFGFGTLVAAALVHKPLQVGGGGGTALDREVQSRVREQGGHEQAGIHNRLLCNDIVNAPTAHDQACLVYLNRARADRAGIHIK